MTDLVGGLRARLIRDSVYHVVYDALDELGWFEASVDDGGTRKHRQVRFDGKPVDHDTEIKFNTIALVDEDLTENDVELGSNLAEHSWTFYVDFFAENDTVGKDLINDVRDILGGRYPSVGRVHASVDVLDYRLATPTPVFRVWIEELVIDKAHGFPKPWQKHWYSCRFQVIDHYGDNSDLEYEPA